MKTSLTLIGTLLFGAHTAHAETYSVDVWADNWFELRVNGSVVGRDSVAITTERSFNAESFQFEADAPFSIGLLAKDFKEDDSGLEYIGTRRQQMGDGGVILQITRAAGDLAIASDASWKCKVIHEAPLDKACAEVSKPVAGVAPCTFTSSPEPDGWASPGFDDSDWQSAVLYSEAQVRPKHGYHQIAWHRSAQLIWGADLETHNTVLCRATVP